MEQKKRPVRKKPSKKTRLLLSSLAKSQCPIKPPSSSSSSSSSCKVQTCGQIPILRARFPPKFRVLVPSSFSRPCPQFQGSLAPTYVLALYSAFPRQEKTFLEEKKQSRRRGKVPKMSFPHSFKFTPQPHFNKEADPQNTISDEVFLLKNNIFCPSAWGKQTLYCRHIFLALYQNGRCLPPPLHCAIRRRSVPWKQKPPGVPLLIFPSSFCGKRRDVDTNWGLFLSPHFLLPPMGSPIQRGKGKGGGGGGKSNFCARLGFLLLHQGARMENVLDLTTFCANKTFLWQHSGSYV